MSIAAVIATTNRESIVSYDFGSVSVVDGTSSSKWTPPFDRHVRCVRSTAHPSRNGGNHCLLDSGHGAASRVVPGHGVANPRQFFPGAARLLALEIMKRDPPKSGGSDTAQLVPGARSNRRCAAVAVLSAVHPRCSSA